jgi:high-affinity Fe2+/Pb2+ permease
MSDTVKNTVDIWANTTGILSGLTGSLGNLLTQPWGIFLVGAVVLVVLYLLFRIRKG